MTPVLITSGKPFIKGSKHKLAYTDMLNVIHQNDDIMDLSHRINEAWENGHTKKAIELEDALAFRLRLLFENLLTRKGFRFDGIDANTLHSLLLG